MILALRLFGLAGCTLLIGLCLWEALMEWTRPRSPSGLLRSLVQDGTVRRVK